MLINQMIQEGYLCQTDDTYSVLRMGSKKDKLRDEQTHVIVRMYEEKEAERRQRKASKTRSTDALTSAGFELFEKLRLLRLEIAREEAMPPYIIFSDKSLIDMCVKLPHSKEEMLNINGVGENKFAKYGQRFIDKIKCYVDEHPNVVISEFVGNIDGESYKVTKRKRNKKEFYITQEQANAFKYGEMYYISEIKEQLNSICDASSVKKVSMATIWDFLVKQELVFEENRSGVFIKTSTDKGKAVGIEIVQKVNQAGFPYELLRYPENVQKLIVNFFVKEIEESDDYLDEEIEWAVNSREISRPVNAGGAWKDTEDNQLITEYKKGMNISEIAQIHRRTRGAIRARLRKKGLIE